VGGRLKFPLWLGLKVRLESTETVPIPSGSVAVGVGARLPIAAVSEATWAVYSAGIAEANHLGKEEASRAE
jgi:hypothetical protein